MSELKNHINTYADTATYNADLTKEFPNISYIEGTDELKWNKYDPVHIVCKYNVASTSSATKLLNSSSGITYQIIDGVQQDTIQTTYTFDTLGEHIVKYKLSGTSISQNVFQTCEGLTSVTIPSSVTSIGGSAFAYCSGLTSITITDSVTTIIGYAFQNCRGLRNITIPSSVTSIGEYAFRNCSILTSITVEATTPPTLGTNAFNDTNANLVIYVPAESVDAYKTTGNWVSLASRIVAIS